MEVKEKQYEKVLRLLRQKPHTTMDFVAQYILAPQKCIEMLRNKGYNIETQDVKGQKYKMYVLKEDLKPSNSRELETMQPSLFESALPSFIKY